MKRRGFLGAIFGVAVAHHFSMPKAGETTIIESLKTYEIRVHRNETVASLTMPVYDNIDKAIRVFGEEEVLKLFNRSWQVECQMIARREMFPRD